MAAEPSRGLASLAALGVNETLDDDALERLVAELPKDDVVRHLHDISALRRALSQCEKMLASRIVAEKILSIAEVWEAPDGEEFVWVGDRHREVKDPAMLRDELRKVDMRGLARQAFHNAFVTQEPKVYLTELDKVAKFCPAAEPIIKSFTRWEESAPRLRSLSEGGHHR